MLKIVNSIILRNKQVNFKFPTLEMYQDVVRLRLKKKKSKVHPWDTIKFGVSLLKINLNQNCTAAREIVLTQVQSPASYIVP